MTHGGNTGLHLEEFLEGQEVKERILKDVSNITKRYIETRLRDTKSRFSLVWYRGSKWTMMSIV